MNVATGQIAETSPRRRQCRADRHCRGASWNSLLRPDRRSYRRDRSFFAADHDILAQFKFGVLPTSIAIGDDGNAWYTASGVIGRFDLTTHQITEFTIPSGDSDPQTITNRPGGELWFTDADKIGRIRSIAVTNTSPFDVPSNATYTLPTGQTFGPGATVPAGTVLPVGTIVEYTLPAGSQGAYGITNTSSDFLWFTLGCSDQIGYINADTAAAVLALRRAWRTEGCGQLGRVDLVPRIGE